MNSSRAETPIATVVMYHVVRDGRGLANRLKGPTVDAFREQLAYIRAHYTPCDLLDLARAVDEGAPLPPRPIVLTFDDGYAGHHDVVFPILRETRTPAVFFPVASSLLNGEVLDVNKIQLILASTTDVDAIVRAIDSTIERDGASLGLPPVSDYRAKWWTASRWDPPSVVYVKRLLQHALPEDVRRRLIDDLFRRFVSSDERAVAAELYMTTAQARTMHRYGMTIGGHGDRHLRLPTLTRDEQAREIDGALRVLDEVGVPRHRFVYSYANGEHDATSVELLRARGCAAAVTTRPDVARLAADTLLTLPRIDTNDLPSQGSAAPNEWTRRAVLVLGASAIAGVITRATPLAAQPQATGDLAYNGIRLPQPWPPRYRSVSPIPITPPYLADPPAVIDIDVGRQLFVDDFLIEDTTLLRTLHRAEYHPASPILRPDAPWEQRDERAERLQVPINPTAMPFSDGVFYDPRERRFRMWYMAGYNMNVAHAVSDDGIQWTRPMYDVVPETNIVLKSSRDSGAVWLDHDPPVPQQRFKMSLYNDQQLNFYTSPDGIHWTRAGGNESSGDRTTFFYNAFRKRWVFSIRGQVPGFDRVRLYYEHADWIRASQFAPSDPVLWAASDRLDEPRTEWARQAQLYNLDAIAYESVLLGVWTIWRGEPHTREKVNELCVGFSRDGFHWHRPDRRAFLGVSDRIGDWNWANVQSAGGCCLIVGDRLHFYVSGRRGVPDTAESGVCSTGLGILRRDGFASMDYLPGDGRARLAFSGREGSLTTRPLRFSGSHLFVNANLDGELRVEALDEEGRPIPRFSRAACEPVRGDGTRLLVTWRDAPPLTTLAGTPVRFRFFVTSGRLYAFWVSPARHGASRGYVAAGGPGFAGPVDVSGDGSRA